MNEIIEQLLTYLQGIWRHRWYALALAWLVCLVGWALVFKLPNQYQASARVYVDTQSVLRPLLQGMTIQSNPSSQIDLMTRTLLSRPNLEKVARMTDLDLKAKDDYAKDELLNDLLKQIQLFGAGRENLYSIAYTNSDSELAKRVVQSLLTIFVENTLGETRQDTDTAQRFLDKQIAEYEQRLVDAENRVAEFKQKYGNAMVGSDGSLYGSIDATKKALESALLELQQATNRRDSIKQQIEQSKPILDTKPVTPEKTVTLVLPIDERIKATQQQLDNLLIRFTDKHPDVEWTRGLLADLQKQREKDLADYKAALQAPDAKAAELNANPIYQQLQIHLAQEEANMASLQTRVMSYQRQLQDLQSKINLAPEIEAQFKALNRDYSLTRSNYDALLARREQARLSQQAEQTSDNIRFRVIEPPRVPTEPSGPNRPALMSSVLVGGLGGGVVFAFLIAQLWPTFDSRRSLMQATNVPVFGSVGVILSPTAVRRERLKILLFFALFILLLLLYMGLLIAQLMHLIKI
ncbi:MAG: XrtA system polysaccharide chain length determinant [Candidatus Competibacteraceae bacterium]